jgi:ABC-type antimicrobial peptide transport system permease subunit
MYKSVQLGVSPIELFRKVDSRSGLMHGLFLTGGAVFVTVAWCAITGAVIGAVAGVFHKLRRV